MTKREDSTGQRLSTSLFSSMTAFNVNCVSMYFCSALLPGFLIKRSGRDNKGGFWGCNVRVGLHIDMAGGAVRLTSVGGGDALRLVALMGETIPALVNAAVNVGVKDIIKVGDKGATLAGLKGEGAVTTVSAMVSEIGANVLLILGGGGLGTVNGAELTGGYGTDSGEFGIGISLVLEIAGKGSGVGILEMMEMGFTVHREPVSGNMDGFPNAANEEVSTAFWISASSGGALTVLCPQVLTVRSVMLFSISSSGILATTSWKIL
ncbi:hypothetical protein RvY_11016-1 [Ramazzottius varieornatus]|uniref:Uncharacterized protein n=1 Tax=Ramazzottius varieornatus TaxID=947166 RepID=A0A1D1VH61_RAMVA|nr:hypothetical protein RvY_11016-1 [Ramazzottius varieornatus]